MNGESRAGHLNAYIKALQGHDWGFEASDDHAAWTRGKDSLESLRTAQKMIDPDHMVWNQFCPAEWRVGCGVAPA